MSVSFPPNQLSVEDTIRELIEQSKSRPIVPFLGAGISVAAGFPTIGAINQYLAKVAFAINFNVYKHRYPEAIGRSHPAFSSQSSVTDQYRRNPSRFLDHFGWLEAGQLNADLWEWLVRNSILRQNRSIHTVESRTGKDELLEHSKEILLRDTKTPRILQDLLALDVSSQKWNEFTETLEPNTECLDLRHQLFAISQFELRRDLSSREPGSLEAAIREWRRWKQWYLQGKWQIQPDLLYGDWESLLDRLCEGNLDLVDALFTGLGEGRTPTAAHRFLAFLQVKLGIPLVMSTNFDTLLERAFAEEGIAHRVFDIHRDADLPDASLVARQFSILKLHGTSYGLRLGERLRYPLEAEARNDVLRYLADNALVVVLGFSGSERRIMQLLNAVAQRRNRVSSNKADMPRTRLLWLKGPGNVSPMLKDLLQNNPLSVLYCEISDINTFLQQFYFQYAGSFQASSTGYPALSCRPVIQLDRHKIRDIPLPPNRPRNHDGTIQSKKYAKAWADLQMKCWDLRRLNRNVLRRPIQVFLSKEPLPDEIDSRRSSWATLAAAQFVTTQIEQGYHPIWIDLESHHTVSGVVADLLENAKQVDPQCPQFSMIGQNSEVLQKAVNRIHQVLARGRYVIVFDSLESFGRTQMMHHGVPSYRAFGKHHDGYERKRHLKSEFERRVQALDEFLSLLLKWNLKDQVFPAKEFFLDSYVCLTIDNPCPRRRSKHKPPQRHRAKASPEDTLEPIETIRKMVRKYRVNKHIDRDSLFPYVRFVEECELGRQLQSIQESLPYLQTGISAESGYNLIPINNLPQNPMQNLTDSWVGRNCTTGKAALSQSLDRLGDVLRLKVFLESHSQRTTNAMADTISVLPNDRCAKAVNVDEIKPRVQAFLGMLSIFRRPRPLPLIRAMLERCLLGPMRKARQGVEAREFFATVDRELLTPLLATNGEDGFGVAQNHEGNSIWLFREVHEAVFDAMTMNLGVSDWVSLWANKGIDAGDEDDKVAALLNGLLLIAWHWQASRVYYADVFMPTRDVHAFYEYIYHRMHVLRTASLMQALMHDKRQRSRLNTVLSHALASLRPPTQPPPKEKESISWFINTLEIFPLGEEVRTLDDVMERLRDLRYHAIETFERALRRNGEHLRSVATPDTLLGWTTQLLDRELLDVSGEIFKYSSADKWEDNPIRAALQIDREGTIVDKLRRLLREMSGAERLTKLEYGEALQRALADIQGVQEGVSESNEKDSDLEANFQRAVECLRSVDDQVINDRSVDARLRRRALVNLAQCCSLFSVDFSDYRSDTITSFLQKVINLAGRSTSKGTEPAIEDKIVAREAAQLLAKQLLRFACLYWQGPDGNINVECCNEETRDSFNKLAKRRTDFCRDAEAVTETYERLIRETADNIEDDARHRSIALALRARCQYLRDQFRQAHQDLDLASAGLDGHRAEHGVARAVVHLYRAELLCYSADWHFREEIEKPRMLGTNECPRTVSKEQMKVNRAEKELMLAEDALHGAVHQTAWLLRIHQGLAQVRLEQILFNVEEIFSQPRRLTQDEHQLLSGEMESLVLRGMESVRYVLDVLPYIRLRWGDMDQIAKRSPLVHMERKLYAQWRQFFVAGAYFTALLRMRAEGVLRDEPHDEQSYDAEITTVAGEAESGYMDFRGNRWNFWCESLRFDALKHEQVPVRMPCLPEEFTLWRSHERRPSLRAMIIQVMCNACDSASITGMWNRRRDSPIPEGRT